MNQFASIQKLRSAMALLLSSKSRLESGRNKNAIKAILDQSASNPLESSSIIQQFLACCIHSKIMSQMIQYFYQGGEIMNQYSRSLNEVIKKYIENNQKSKLDEPGAKQVRHLLAKKISQDEVLMSAVIELAKSDQGACDKLLKLVEEYFREKKVAGNVTEVVILCVNLIKMRSTVGHNIIKNCLSITNLIFKQSEVLRRELLHVLTVQCQLILREESNEKECIQILNSCYKYCQNFQTKIQMIENVISILRRKPKSKKIAFFEKEGGIEKEQSREIVEFLKNALHFITDTRKGPTEFQSRKISLKKEMDELCQELLLIIDCTSVGRLLEVMNQEVETKNQRILLAQCLTNCLPYDNQQSKIQEEVMTSVFLWIANLSNEGRSGIATQLKLQQTTGDMLSGPSIFMDYIKRTIENQFQFQLNKESLRSVCDLFCHLVPALDNHLIKRDSIMEIAKMLLNLNESCEKEYRQFLVKTVVKIICVYSNQFLKQNAFLKEVIEGKFIRQIFDFEKQIRLLLKNNLIPDNFFDTLLRAIDSGEYTGSSQKQKQFLCDILVVLNKERMQKDCLGWEWSAYVNAAGKKNYGKEWTISEKQLKSIKENKMAPFFIEFEIDMAKIDALLQKNN